jgi:cysteine-rich repeat protein
MRHVQLACFAVVSVGAHCGCGGSGSSSPCGNGILDTAESCDDGNSNSGDGCSSKCTVEDGWTCNTPTGGTSTCTPICGDGVVAGSEVCDDGATTAGDGCSASCLVEDGWQCTGEPSACTLLPARLRSPPVLGVPITGLPARTWSYVAFPDAVCGMGQRRDCTYRRDPKIYSS